MGTINKQIGATNPRPVKLSDDESSRFFSQDSYTSATTIAKKISHEAGNTKKVAASVSRIRAIGNSKGIILNNQLMEAAGFVPDTDVLIQAKDGVIVITQAKNSQVNTDITTWDEHFKKAIKKGAKPDKDLFDSIGNDFDKTEW